MGKKRYEILIVAAAVIITATAGVFLPKLRHHDGLDSYVKNGGTTASHDEEAREKEPVGEEPVNGETEEKAPEETKPVTTEPETTEPVITEPETTEPVITEPEPTEPVTTQPETTEPVVTEPEEQPKDIEFNMAWVDQKIKEYEDQIDPADLEDFRTIIGKLDMGHVTEILEGGFTEENQNRLREYLLSRLTPDEYERAKELFITYSYLLFD